MTTNKRNAFNALCMLASSEKWCWNIGCSTCGHMHFRYAFFEISIGRHPDSLEWVTTMTFNDFPCKGKEDWFSLADQLELSSELHQVLADANIKEIASTCRYPDFLGYMGLGLAYTNSLEQLNRIITPSWCEQLIEMVEEDTWGFNFLNDLLLNKYAVLEWRNMEIIEGSLKSRYRCRYIE